MIKNKLFLERKSLRWSMVKMLLFGWFFPLLVLGLLMIFFVSGRVNNQVQNTIETSTEKATQIYKMQIEESVVASKNASYLPIIKEAYQSYKQTGNIREFRDSVSVFLEQQYKFTNGIKDAILILPTMPNQIFYTYNNSTNTTYNDIRRFENTARSQIETIAKTLDTGVKLVNIEGRVFLVRNLLDSKFNTYATLVLELDQKSIMESLESIWGYEDAAVYVEDTLLMSSKSEELKSDGIKEQFDFVKNNQMSYVRKPGYSYLCSKTKIEQNQIMFLVTLNNQVIYAQLWVLRVLFAGLILFLIPLVFLVLRFFHNKVTNPVNEMVMAAQEIEKGHFGTQITNMADSDEFCYMEETMNHMSLQLKNQFEKIYLEEIALRDAKIMALQSQINPHFLNNTLEIINWEARLGGNVKASAMIEALSTMLEATTNRKSESFITLHEEMAYVDAYLYIISQRFGEKFHVEKEIDESLLDTKIPRLIIQPIVENAVEHGIDISRQGTIFLHIYKKGDQYICIDVEDNGVLTNQEKEKIHNLLTKEPDSKSEKRISLGIRNVDQRIKIIYGEDCGLSIDSNERMHTVSTLLIKCSGATEQ